MERLRLFATVLERWNQRINLIGPRELAHLWDRHIDDCLHLVPLLPAAGRIVDLGSGAGFPGIVVAIATERAVTLIEADQRKAAFLRECARAVGVNVTVISERIEHCAIRDADIITARAVAPLPKLLDLAAPLMGPSAICLLLKGARVQSELTEAERRWQMSLIRHAGRPASDGCILEVRHLRRTLSGAY